MRNNEHTLDAVAQELASTSGWSEPQARAVLDLIVSAAQKQADGAVEKQARRRKSAKVIATRQLLKNYHNLKQSIESGVENTVAVLHETEFQRLMEDEKSLKAQQVLSLAIQTASNKVLWTRLETALDCLKEICKKSPSAGIQRGYALIHDRYLQEGELDLKALFAKYHIEQSVFYQNLNDAESILSLILFGPDSAEDFCTGIAK